MKFRTGFVSNSSSSSFVVFGVRLNDSKIADLQSQRAEAALKGWSKPENHGEDCECSKCQPPEVEDLDLYEMCDDAGLQCSGFTVGLSPRAMADTETLAQFKERCAANISKLFYEVSTADIRYIEQVDSD